MTNPNDSVRGGLTKREYFAALALQGILAADVNNNLYESDAAEQAVLQADTLIAALNKEDQADG